MNNYTTGTVANVNTLLTALDTWLVSTVGYTRNLAPTAIGAGNRAHYQITTPNGNVLYPNFRSFRKENNTAIWSAPSFAVNTSWNLIDGLALVLSKAWAGSGTAWDLQGGQPTSGDNYYTSLPVYAGALDNIPSYHFFWLSNPHMCVVVLEWNLGLYSYLIWGEPDPSGAGTFSPNNGYYYMGSSLWYGPFNYSATPSMPSIDGLYIGHNHPMWYSQFFTYQTTQVIQHNQFFQLDPTLHTGANGWLGPADDVASFSARNTTHAGTAATDKNPGMIGPHHHHDTTPYYRVPRYDPNQKYRIMRRSSNINTGNAVFLPHYFYWIKNLNDAVYLGCLPELYHVYLRDITPQGTITLGADNWMVFPWGQKNSPFDPDETGTSGRIERNYGTGFVIKKP